MRVTTEHWNPVTKKDRVLPSPAYCNADDTTTFWLVCFRPSLTFRSDQWQIQENQGQCPLSNQHGWHRLFILNGTSYHSQTFFFISPFQTYLKMNRWTCFMSLPTLVTRLGQLHSLSQVPLNITLSDSDNPLNKQTNMSRSFHFYSVIRFRAMNKGLNKIHFYLTAVICKLQQLKKLLAAYVLRSVYFHSSMQV